MRVIDQAAWPKAFQSRSLQMQTSPSVKARPVRKITSFGLPKVFKAQISPRPITTDSQASERTGFLRRRRVPASSITTTLKVNHAPLRYNARVIMKTSYQERCARNSLHKG